MKAPLNTVAAAVKQRSAINVGAILVCVSAFLRTAGGASASSDFLGAV